jgi:hypothetical protein
MKLIIDADPIVYRAGFSAEAHDYHIVYEGPDGEVHEVYFKGKEDKKGKWKTAGAWMKEWMDDPKRGGHEQVEILSKEKVITPEPKDHALNIVRQEVEGIIAAVASKTGCNPQDMSITIVLTGPGNFREKIAKQRPYKGNRDAAHKPYWYQAIRDYLTGRWDARVVSGREADDECSIVAWGMHNDGDNAYVVATIDKDLDQIPGLHYDYRQKVFYYVDPSNASRAFWVQALAGDATDNIPGCYKIGMTKAEAVIDKVIDSCGGQWPLPSEFWNVILEQYKLSKERNGCPYAEGDAREVAIETARLVYMQRRERELWTPPGEPEQWLGVGDD